MKNLTIFTGVAIFTVTAASAQQIAEAPTPPPPGTQTDDGGRNPAVTYLMQVYNLSETEAAERIALQDEVGKLAEQLTNSDDPTFADIEIQHEPTFKIIVSFADKSDRKAFLQSVEPKIRRYVQIKQVKRSKSARKGEMRRLEESLNGGRRIDVRAGEAPFVVTYNNDEEIFTVYIPTNAMQEELAAQVPDNIKSEVRFVVGALPRPSQSGPEGVQPGDWATAGYTIYPAKDPNSLRCTIGFSVRYGLAKKPAVLTSAHCNLPQHLYYNNHWITLKSPLFKRWDSSHDFQILDIGSMNTASWVYAWEAENIPEFTNPEWFEVTGMNSYASQTEGTVVCKSGAKTGITCGQIVDADYSYGGTYGQPWIKVSKTYQSDISQPGDSGGAWFVYPGSSQRIRAVGVHTAGPEGDSGFNSVAIYMPIDRVFKATTAELIATP